MNEHDGKIDATERFRWAIEINHGYLPILGNCFFKPQLLEPDPLLRSVNSNKRWIPPFHMQMGLDFVNLTKNSEVLKTLESLHFDKPYEIKYHKHDGAGLPGKLLESWELAFCHLKERLVTGQPNSDLFTLHLKIQYYQIKYFPASND